MAGGELDVTERDSGVKGGHDEGGPQHVGMDDSQPGPLANGADPAVGCTPVESFAVVAMQDRALAALTEHEVDCASHSWDEWDHRRLVALADDVQRPMASVEAQILRVGGACLTHSKPI
jgi:hypothetical protein